MRFLTRSLVLGNDCSIGKANARGRSKDAACLAWSNTLNLHTSPPNAKWMSTRAHAFSYSESGVEGQLILWKG